MDRQQYEEDLKRRQEEHLRSIRQNSYEHSFWQPCLHDQCPECIGTGIRRDGSICVHGISCPCPKCSTSCVSTSNITCESVGKNKKFHLGSYGIIAEYNYD